MMIERDILATVGYRLRLGISQWSIHSRSVMKVSIFSAVSCHQVASRSLLATALLESTREANSRPSIAKSANSGSDTTKMSKSDLSPYALPKFSPREYPSRALPVRLICLGLSPSTRAIASLARSKIMGSCLKEKGTPSVSHCWAKRNTSRLCIGTSRSHLPGLGYDAANESMNVSGMSLKSSGDMVGTQDHLF